MNPYNVIDMVAITTFKSHSNGKQPFELQAQIFVTALFFAIAEKKEIKKTEIDDVVKSKTEIIDMVLGNNILREYDSEISDAAKEIGYTKAKIIITKNFINKLEEALNRGDSLESLGISTFNELLYHLYIKPFSRYDDEDYFERWLSEFIKYKEVFFKDYSMAKAVINNLVDSMKTS